MKQLLFLLLFPCLALAQYTGNAGQKITLGEQTTADGLVYRGNAADTVAATLKITKTNKSDTSAFLLLDTINNVFLKYNIGTTYWTRLNILPTDTASMLNNYWRSGKFSGVLPVANGGTGITSFGTNVATFLGTPSSANLAAAVTNETGSGSLVFNTTPTFSGNVTINNLNPSGLLKYGAAITSPEEGWNELPGVWAIGGTYPNARFYASTTGGSYGYTFFQARNSAVNTPLVFFSSLNVMNGRTSIGFVYNTEDTTAWLTLANGTGSIAPLKLKTSGATLLSPVQAGAVEFNGTNLLFTPSTTRHTVNHGLTGSATLNFPSTTTLLSADLTITVTGAADGDVVSLGVPNAAVNANTSYSAWVSAANTVTVRFNNYSAGTVDPASGLFKVFVTK